MSTIKPILLSGIQPSGHLTIANYIGAIKHWVNLQSKYDCLFQLADLHTITVKQEPDKFRKSCFDFLALYIACGIDPDQNVIFVQSHVPAHAQLTWVLNCFTYMGELQRMTQFKDKSKRYPTNLNVGLFDYPVLQASDILLYKTNLVPVGSDQKQHLELARDIAIRFNNLYGEIFTIPELFIPPIGGRIMGLQEPTKKMSKSDTNASNYISLLDSPDDIRNKLKRSVTDSGADIHYDQTSKPGISNLLALYSVITDQSIETIEKKYEGSGYGQFKNDIAEVVIEFLKPLQEHYSRLRSDEKKILKILKHGDEIARKRSNEMLTRVHDAIGFIPMIPSLAREG